MKFIKIAALILLVAILGCSFIACDSNNDQNKNENNAPVEKDTTPPPEGSVSQGLTEVTVSFEIKDSSGTNIYRAIDYKYKGFDPTILGVLKYYFEVEIDEYFATYEDELLADMIWIIGGYEAESGQYWAALRGTEFKDGSGNVINMKNLLKPENEALFNSYIISSMSEHTLTNGETFTVVLAGTKTEAEEPAV